MRPLGYGCVHGTTPSSKWRTEQGCRYTDTGSSLQVNSLAPNRTEEWTGSLKVDHGASQFTWLHGSRDHEGTPEFAESTGLGLSNGSLSSGGLETDLYKLSHKIEVDGQSDLIASAYYVTTDNTYSGNDRWIASIFGQVDYEFSSRLHFLIGTRYDDYSDFGGRLSPWAGIIYHADEDSAIKALYGHAFRAPSNVEQGTIPRIIEGGGDDLNGTRRRDLRPLPRIRGWQGHVREREHEGRSFLATEHSNRSGGRLGDSESPPAVFARLTRD